jgi:hypothetical protein
LSFFFTQNVASQTLSFYFILFSLYFFNIEVLKTWEKKLKFHAKTKEPRQNIYNLKIERRVKLNFSMPFETTDCLAFFMFLSLFFEFLFCKIKFEFNVEIN